MLRFITARIHPFSIRIFRTYHFKGSIVIFLCACIKVMLFYSFSLSRGDTAKLTLQTIPALIVIYGLVNLCGPRVRSKAYILAHFLFSFLLFTDLLYYQYFGSAPSVQDLANAGAVPDIANCIPYVIRMWYFLLFIDIIPIAVFLHYHDKKRKNTGARWRIPNMVIVILAFIIMVPGIVSASRIDRSNVYGYYNIVTYHVNDVFKTIWKEHSGSIAKTHAYDRAVAVQSADASSGTSALNDRAKTTAESTGNDAAAETAGSKTTGHGKTSADAKKTAVKGIEKVAAADTDKAASSNGKEMTPADTEKTAEADVEKTAAADAEKTPADGSKPVSTENAAKKYFGIAKGRNLIVIQMEATQNFIVNRKYNGQEIMPNLDKLIGSDSIYYDNYFSNIGKGNTSDAEFVTNNSLYPSYEVSTYKQFAGNTFDGLPWVLRSLGYNTAAFHAYDPDFWNRKAAYPGQGFQRFYSRPDFKPGETIGMGLDDVSFFKQSVNYMKQMKKPFYSFLITLSSHTPFDHIPKKYQTMDLLDKHKGTMFGNYLEAQHYTDMALGVFISELKKAGLYDNSIITFYGDHFGLGQNIQNNSSIMKEILGHDYGIDDCMNVPLAIHIPGSKLNLTNHIVGAQLDFMPTVLNLMGIAGDGLTMQGQDLNNAANGFYAEHTYMRKGSFITDGKVYIIGPGGSFEKGIAWDRATKKPVDIDSCREGSDKALKDIEESMEIMRQNLLKR